MIDLKLVPLWKSDAFGFKVLQLQLRNNGKIVDSKNVYSGSPAAQNQPFIQPAKDWAGSGNPIPEGIYSLGTPERGDFGAGIGGGWIGLEVLKGYAVNNRGNFGIHNDDNRSTARGSAGCVVTWSAADWEYIAKWLSATARPTQLVVDYSLGFLKAAGYRDPALSLPAPGPVAGKPPVKTKALVMLERGHGPNPDGWEPGICANGVREYDLNGIAVEACRSELTRIGIISDVTDSGLSLHGIGQLASGYDVFVSFHHNGFNSSAQGTEVLVSEGNADQNDRDLAGDILHSLCESLGFPNRGVKEQNLGVLRGAESTNVRACCLTEGYFLDAVTSGHHDLSIKYGIAVARGIAKWLGVPLS